MKHKNFFLLVIVFLALPMSSLAAVVQAVKGAPLAVAFVNSYSADDSNSYYAKKLAPKGISSTFYACIDKADSNLSGVTVCISDEEKFQDARLNKVYKELMTQLKSKPKAKDSLISAERAWIDSTTKDRAFESTIYSDVQVDDLQQSQNDVFRTCERSNVLENYLELSKGK